MKRLLVLAMALAFCAPAAFAADTDPHDVTVTIPTVNEVYAGANVTLTFVAPAPGSGFTDATNTGTLAWTTNQAGRKITVGYDAVDSGIALYCTATSVTGGTAAAEVTIGTVAADFVTGIANTTGGATLSYRATANLSAVTSTMTVTYTVAASA